LPPLPPWETTIYLSPCEVPWWWTK
jgi:hypothetical protein